jgi:hypothetical protein
MYICIVLCVLIVFSLCQESLKLILVDKPLPKGILSHDPHTQCPTGAPDGEPTV